jgi:membrane-associated phospholipid phosphatase
MNRGTSNRPAHRQLTPTDQLLLAAAGLVVLVICGAIAHSGNVGAAERRVFRAIKDQPAWLYPLLWPFQQFGNLIIALVLTLIVAAVLRNWRLAAAAVAAAVLKLGSEKLIKVFVERERPGTTILGFPRPQLHGDVPLHGLSFVSGHAVMSTAVAGLVSPLLAGRWKIVPWALVALNGVARIYVGAHNPLDIIGGIGAGLVIAGVLNFILRPNGAAATAGVAGTGGSTRSDSPS